VAIVVCFRGPPQLNERQSQVVVNLTIGGPKFQGPLELRHRLLRFFLVHQNVAQVVAGFGVIGLESQRLPQAQGRLVEMAQLGQGHAEVVMRLGEVGPQPHGVARSVGTRS
jgi:hypothetical protein